MLGPHEEHAGKEGHRVGPLADGGRTGGVGQQPHSRVPQEAVGLNAGQGEGRDCPQRGHN